MLHFLSRRALHGLGLLFVVSMICFVLIHAPEGDYASQEKAVAISQYGMSEAAAETYARHLRERLGLDRPLLLQYVGWIGGIVLHGDFGQSFAYNKPVAQVVGERLP